MRVLLRRLLTADPKIVNVAPLKLRAVKRLAAYDAFDVDDVRQLERRASFNLNLQRPTVVTSCL